MNVNLSDHEKRVIIWYEYQVTHVAKEIHERIVGRLGDGVVSKSTVQNWITKFKWGRESLKNGISTGRPITATTEANIATIRELIVSDPRITISQIECISGFSRGAIQVILHKHLRVQKRECRFVPHKLTPAHMKARVKISQENLKMWRNGGQNLIDRITTEDEVYVYYYDNPAKGEAKIWVFEGDTPPKVVKRDRTIGKVLYAVFFNTRGLVACVKLEGQKSVTANWFTTICLPKVFSKGTGGRQLLHMDNASSHTAKITSDYMCSNNIEKVPHPPYSPDLAMADFWLFSGLKRNLRGRTFGSEEELDAAVMTYFEDKPKEDWQRAFTMWKSRMERCIIAKGDYFK